MRHTDVLLKVRPDSYADDERKRQEQLKLSLNQLQTKLRIINELGKTEGWKVFQADLANEERRLLSMLELADNPTHLAKLTGTLLAVKSFVNYVSDSMIELDAQAKALTEE